MTSNQPLYGLYLIFFLTLGFIMMKLSGMIDWMWMWVLSPALLPLVGGLMMVFVGVIIIGIVSLYDKYKEK